MQDEVKKIKVATRTLLSGDTTSKDDSAKAITDTVEILKRSAK